MMNHETKDATEEFLKLVTALSVDTKIFHRTGSAPVNHAFRRAYVRSVFSFIDGIISTIKKELLVEYDIANDQTLITRARHVLESKVIFRDKHGVLKERPFYAPLAEDVKTTISYFAYFNLVDHYVDEESRAWKRFIKAIAIRNRITHPETANALEISDAELATVESAHAWFVNNIKLIYEKLLRR